MEATDTDDDAIADDVVDSCLLYGTAVQPAQLSEGRLLSMVVISDKGDRRRR